jgi:hypothetical protein
MAEKALTAVVQEGYVQGVSTRAVADLVQAMGMSGISKRQVSRLCAEIDDKVKAFPARPDRGRLVRVATLSSNPRYPSRKGLPETPGLVTPGGERPRSSLALKIASSLFGTC